MRLRHRRVARPAPSWRRLATGALILAVAVPAGAALPDSAGAGPGAESEPGTAAPASPGDVAAPHDLDAGTYPVTLITGDQVTLQVTADRRVRIEVDPAPRPDGSTPEITWHSSDGGLLVLPDDVQPLLEAGALDQGLFDVGYLAANGYADDASEQLPLIVEHADRSGPAARWSATDLPGSTPGTALASVDATAVGVAKAQAPAFWAALAGDRSGASPAVRAFAPPGIERIWLDRVAQIDLDDSVPQIGAPEAWAAGFDGSGVTVAVLDTGIDPDHPDLAGRVIAARSFIVDTEPVDGHGHGTHVAATVAGTGAAAGGQYDGVAPAASLAIGKVCTDGGECPASAVIAGMEWAAVEQDADVVNLSVGGCCTDGTDPMSQAVNQLTAATGTLFVVAAGNSGPNPFTVESPGAADAALTVGAVDKTGQLASFSSRGPRNGDSALKPEITAPGVDIVAARAAGTSMGTPVDGSYTAANGTSMATPHVAGAAALLAQRHPEWQAEQLKAALIATATDGGYSVYQQGGGLVDVARAVGQQVQVSPAVLDFGLEPYPQVGPPRTATLTYTNHTGDDLQLTLTAELAGVDGTPVPDQTLAVDPEQFAVPAGESATVAVTLDHTAPVTGQYTGRVVASSADGIRLTNPVGLAIGEQTHQLTVQVSARDCDRGVLCAGDTTSFAFGQVILSRIDDASADPPDLEGPAPATASQVLTPSQDDPAGPDQATARVQVPAGVYAVGWRPHWVDANTSRVQSAWLWITELTVTGDTEVSLAANDAIPVRFDPPQPADSIAPTRAFHWFNADRSIAVASGSVSAYGIDYWTSPTDPVRSGTFLASHLDVLAAPQLAMTVARPDPVRLHPSYSGYRPEGYDHFTVPVRFPAGTRTLPVVYVGQGNQADYAGLDVRDRLVLVQQPEGPCQVGPDLLERAAGAGAAGVLVHPGGCPVPMSIADNPSNSGKPPIPYATLPAADATLLVELLRAGPVEVTVTSTPEPGYTYILKGHERQQIPGSLRYQPTVNELVAIDAHYHADQDTADQDGWISQKRVSWHPDEFLQPSQTYDLPAPAVRTEYWGPVDPEAWHERYADRGVLAHLPAPIVRVDVFDRPDRHAEHWNDHPWVPGAAVAPTGFDQICAGCREADTLWPQMYLAGGDEPYSAGILGVAVPTTPDPRRPWDGLRLWRDGIEIPQELFFGALPTFPLSPDAGQYRLAYDIAGTGYDSHTAWEFTSEPVADRGSPTENYWCFNALLVAEGEPRPDCYAEPLLFLHYQGLDLDLYNRARALGAHRFEVTAYRQPTPYDQPELTGLRLWVSYDGGSQWDPVRVRPDGEGRFQVTVVHPPARRRGSDVVSLRAEAWDVAGNRLMQTVPVAYRLADYTAGPDGPQ